VVLTLQGLVVRIQGPQSGFSFDSRVFCVQASWSIFEGLDFLVGVCFSAHGSASEFLC
jgi:hypothetical protein